MNGVKTTRIGVLRLSLCLLLLLSFLSTTCSKVPITGRSKLDLIPTDTVLSMSFQQYDEFLASNELSRDEEQTEMVKRAGTRIQSAVEQFFAEHDMSHELEGYQWDFNLVESEEVNAWCMPGGKVVVYSGILPVTEDETGLAVVMGHEIAHAVAEHGNERMSQALLTELGGMALYKALEKEPERTQQLWMTAFGVGAAVGVLLPYSRLHESEADHLGLVFMAMAGYDPRRAVTFWEKMSEAKDGSPPEFLSTHPSDETRIRKIQELLPEALQYYEGES